MNSDVKAKWVEALRSGQYKQGRGYLNQVQHNEFCCLGVLCEIAVEEGVIPKSTDGELMMYGDQNGQSGDISTAALPNKVVEWAGLNGRFPSANHQSLTDLNDNGTSFERIATLIEEHL